MIGCRHHAASAKSAGSAVCIDSRPGFALNPFVVLPWLAREFRAFCLRVVRQYVISINLLHVCRRFAACPLLYSHIPQTDQHCARNLAASQKLKFSWLSVISLAFFQKSTWLKKKTKKQTTLIYSLLHEIILSFFFSGCIFFPHSGIEYITSKCYWYVKCFYSQHFLFRTRFLCR